MVTLVLPTMNSKSTTPFTGRSLSPAPFKLGRVLLRWCVLGLLVLDVPVAPFHPPASDPVFTAVDCFTTMAFWPFGKINLMVWILIWALCLIVLRLFIDLASWDASWWLQWRIYYDGTTVLSWPTVRMSNRTFCSPSWFKAERYYLYVMVMSWLGDGLSVPKMLMCMSTCYDTRWLYFCSWEAM